MNIFKRVALVLILCIILALIISIFLPAIFKMERSVIINADKEIVFNQVNDLKKWKNWSTWAVKDPAIFIKDNAFSTPSFGKGATFSWQSKHKDVGEGLITIVESIKNKSINTTIDFGVEDLEGSWIFRDVEDGIEVKWVLQVDFGFNPISKFYGLFMEAQFAPDCEKGLEKLKNFSEDLPKIHKVVVAEKMLEKDSWILSIRDTVKQNEMNNIHGKNYAEINKFLDDAKIDTDGSPLVIYHLWTAEKVDIEVAIPVNDSTIVGNDRVKLNRIKKTKVVFATHYGPYDRLPETYFGINEYMRKNKVVVSGSPWETYITDPASEPNPEKWETVVYFPID